MTDSFKTLLQTVVTVLKADAPLTALVSSRIYTDVPDNEVFPYVVVRLSTGDYSVKETDGMEHTIQVSAFSRKPSPNEAASIRSAVYDKLNRNEAALSAAAVSNIMFNGISDVFKDPDGQTWQAAIQFRTVIL